jgi:hypothetical protein
VNKISTKYSPTHEIIWGGDLNASLTRHPPTKQDMLLRNFCQEQSFKPYANSIYPTFYHHNGATSQIDYILYKGTSGDCTKYDIADQDPLNLSTVMKHNWGIMLCKMFCM